MASFETCTGPVRRRVRAAAVLGGALALLGASPAWTAERMVYSGTLGTAQVVMELSSSEDSQRVTGRYFYLRYGIDIPLSGTPGALAEAIPLADESEGGNAPVFEDAGTGKPAVVWDGRLHGARRDRYEGQWRDARSGRTLPFALRRVAAYDPDAAAPDSVEAATISMASAPYDFLRMQVPMTAGAEVRLGPVAYRMVVDPRTQFAYPRLTRHPDPAVMARANAILEQRHWHMSVEALACKGTLYTSTGPAAGTLGGFDNESISVEFLSPTLMSVAESGSTDCGGAYPNNHFDPFTLDLRHGGYLDFNRLLDAGVRDEYGKLDPSPALAAFIDRHPASRQGDLDDNCGGETLKDYLALYFQSSDKLALAVSDIPHVMGACLGPQIAVPVKDLGTLLKPEAARYFPDLALPAMKADG